MKVLWLSHFLLFPETGYGGLQRSRNLLKSICNQHEVILVCLYRDVDKYLVPDLRVAEKDLKNYCKKVIFIPHNLTIIKKFILLFKSFITNIPYSVYIYKSRSFNKDIYKLISNTVIDLIHTDTIGLFEALLGNNMAINVLNHHDIESHKLYRRYSNEKNVFKRLFFLHEYRCMYKYEQYYCNNYHLNIVVSEMDRDRLKMISKNINIKVIENGVDSEYFAYHSRDCNSKELIFTGAMDYYPNTNAMLYFCNQIWPKLKERFADLKLIIIGKNPPIQIISLINKIKDIELLGYVEDIRPYIKRAKVFICPIMEGGGTRIKILDAFSQGIPVVSTEIGAEGLHLENGKHIFLANTAAEFVEKVSELIENNELSRKISINARKLIEENYSYKYIGEKLAKAYEETLRK